MGAAPVARWLCRDFHFEYFWDIVVLLIIFLSFDFWYYNVLYNCLGKPDISGIAWRQVLLPDCARLGESELSHAITTCLTPRLEVLSLGYCGRGMSDTTAAETFKEEVRICSNPFQCERLRLSWTRGGIRSDSRWIMALCLAD